MSNDFSLNDLSTFVSTGSNLPESETFETAVACSDDAACSSDDVCCEISDEACKVDEAVIENAVDGEPYDDANVDAVAEPVAADETVDSPAEEDAGPVDVAEQAPEELEPVVEVAEPLAEAAEPVEETEPPVVNDETPPTAVDALEQVTEVVDSIPEESAEDLEAVSAVAEVSEEPEANTVLADEETAEAADVEEPESGFKTLGLRDEILKAVLERGYSQPTPIQAETIPYLLAGRDLFGQAQTGTGKTAAFALPLLSRLDLSQKLPQVLVLAPTRELALQVSESFERYGAGLEGFRCTAIYGGSDFYPQIRDLRQGVHVVVGTPGRVIDHMKRGTLQLNQLKTIVLDEADEMLRMGFVDDVTWVLSQTPEERQVALFSATLPEPIRRIAREHQRDPKEIRIESEVRTAETVRQRSIVVNWRDKVDALARILEVEETDGVIVFVATKSTTTELADQLIERGFNATPLNGDIPQNLRERTVEQLKAGRIDIIVATDVAARGLDVSRVSHVINFDLPTETESYVHRIGRTGRAGRSGEAIAFVKPQERRLVRRIEESTGQRIEHMQLPTVAEVNEVRLAKFKQRISDTLEAGNLDFFTGLINQYQQETNTPPWQVAAALAKLMQGDTPLLMEEPPKPKREPKPERQRDRRDEFSDDRPPRQRREGNSGERSGRPDEGMERFRIEVGLTHGVKPGNIVGAIANEAGLDGCNIGRVSIFDEHSTVDLPLGMPKEIFLRLKQTWVSGRQLRISRVNGRPPQPTQRAHAGIKGKRQFHKSKPPQHGKRKSRRES
jgi:ATP-dependent RNA helicase DeaD